jgi:PTS system mannose-specific IIB component
VAIVLARIDDRLLHGQVVVAWRQVLAFDIVYVIDDGVAGDPYLVDTLRLAAPFDLQVRVLSVAEATAALTDPPPGRAILLFKTPQAALALVEAGVGLSELNVGNLASGMGRKRVQRSIALSVEEAEALDTLSARGVQVTFQQTPEERAVRWEVVRRKVTR